MLITDLHRFLDLPDDTPRPAWRLAEHVSNVVRAATAGDSGTEWESTLPCRRRPANRACPGRMIVLRTEPGAPIRWRCSVCDDTGVISNWEDSAFDLRRRQLTLAGEVSEIVIPNEVAAALRDLLEATENGRFAVVRDGQLLDSNCERLVFRIHAHPDGAVLAATDDDLVELIGSVAAEANHEPNRRRQQRLDAAFDALNDAAARSR